MRIVACALVVSYWLVVSYSVLLTKAEASVTSPAAETADSTAKRREKVSVCACV